MPPQLLCQRFYALGRAILVNSFVLSFPTNHSSPPNQPCASQIPLLPRSFRPSGTSVPGCQSAYAMITTTVSDRMATATRRADLISSRKRLLILFPTSPQSHQQVIQRRPRRNRWNPLTPNRTNLCSRRRKETHFLFLPSRECGQASHFPATSFLITNTDNDCFGLGDSLVLGACFRACRSILVIHCSPSPIAPLDSFNYLTI
jgi:hypothetical protein